jgi:hypothetical protein
MFMEVGKLEINYFSFQFSFAVGSKKRCDFATLREKYKLKIRKQNMN